MSIKRPSLRQGPDHTRPLPWGPPALTNPRMVTVTSDPATHKIQLNTGEDCIVTADAVVTFAGNTANDSIIDIVGGRNIVVRGLHVVAEPGPSTTVAQAVAADDTTIRVQSTEGFPDAGVIRLDGEGIIYTAKTATQFTGCTRRSGYYNSSPLSSDTVHSVGATIWLGEYSRSGLTATFNAGHVFIEGCLFDGFINDGIRIIGGNSNSVTIQNVRIGPVRNNDPVAQRDGHPDGIQLAQGGTPLLRIARTTILAEKSGRTILNAASGGSYSAVANIQMQDVDMIAVAETSRLIENADPTIWEVSNSWLRSYAPKSYVCQDSSLAEKLGLAEVVSAVPDFCPVGLPGVGYVSPGYV